MPETRIPTARRPPAKAISIDAVSCVLCGRCVEACPERALIMLLVDGAAGEAARIAFLYQSSTCTRCLLCVRACPAGACSLERLPIATPAPRAGDNHESRDAVHADLEP